jgi:hypothetical protein
VPGVKADDKAPTAAELGLDPGLVLLKDTGALLDSRFVAALQTEIEEQLGSQAAVSVLLQIGFANGMRDAYRALETAQRAARGPAPPVTPALALRLRVQPSRRPRGSVVVRGSWPERIEAAARLSRDGPRNAASCFLSAGYTSGWLSGTLEADMLALETDCAATGAPQCGFVAREADAWRADGDPRAAALLEALPFEAFRALARADLARAEAEEAPPDSRIDREAAVVHIWGPVMVIPYSAGDEVLQAIELIGNDPSAREVSVIVVDLAGAAVDEGFAAAALEQIVDSAEAWGAETLFAGISPLAEAAVADMARPPLLVRKDLDEAIAVAFQIARSQHANL